MKKFIFLFFLSCTGATGMDIPTEENEAILHPVRERSFWQWLFCKPAGSPKPKFLTCSKKCSIRTGIALCLTGFTSIAFSFGAANYEKSQHSNDYYKHGNFTDVIPYWVLAFSGFAEIAIGAVCLNKGISDTQDSSNTEVEMATQAW